MLDKIVKTTIGSRNDRLLKHYRKIVKQINAWGDQFKQLSDEALQSKTAEFSQRYQQGESLNKLLPEAFATVREVSERTLGMRHFDVQLIGGITLHHGRIAEMRTGEGKTLVATLPAYLNALTGQGVHIVTVNDYLAKRDAEWMQPIYDFLGLSVGVNMTDLTTEQKQQAYQADVTYGTNNEFGFDYLRDNMAFSLEEKVQRQLNFAIVDEVDSILIDEARTPLIISGQAEDNPDLYSQIDRLVPKLKEQKEDNEENIIEAGDYTVDEKRRQVNLTEDGHQHVEQLFRQAGLLEEGQSLYDPAFIGLMYHLNACLRARTVFTKDVDYIVKNREVIIIDEHTGRSMPGRRWSDGLHQAMEAKEGVPIQNENQTLASITFQNFFRLYNKLAGMTGTADTEAFEFQQIYGLEVVIIPPNKPVQRTDYADRIFLNQTDKFEAIVEEIKECQQRQQPVLLGTASIDVSEHLSKLLKKAKIKHQVLNAKHHEREAQIIQQAGRPGTITIATNMAGRGTDIVLGGNLDAELAQLDNPSEADKEAVRADWRERNKQVIEAGGLHILGSERHESRRIDKQLRGRCARQGDPGSTRFYLSLEDHLLRIFAPPRLSSMMQRLGMETGDSIEHRFISRAIENAQRKVEGHNFDVRKQLLEYDDVANEQRKVVYQQRNDLLEADSITDTIEDMLRDVAETMSHTHIPPGTMEEEWEVQELENRLYHEMGLELAISHWVEQDHTLQPEDIESWLIEQFEATYDAKKQSLSEQDRQYLEKMVMLQILDMHWKEHLAAMDHLRQGIHLRGYAQKDPRQEYKKEAFSLFSSMLDTVKFDTIKTLLTFHLEQADVSTMDETMKQEAEQQKRSMQYAHGDLEATNDDAGQGEVDPDSGVVINPVKREGRKVGRNEICPCGSGVKYKHCCGRLS